MSSTLEGIQLSLYTDEEVRALSAVQVLYPTTLERSLPKSNGLSDTRFGVTDRNLRCATCGQTDCFQHFGHIELFKPVCRLGQISLILYILRSVCWACSRRKFTIKGEKGCFLDARSIISRTPSMGKERLRAISEACKNRFKCPWDNDDLALDDRCGAPQPSYVVTNKTFFKRTFREKEDYLFDNEEEKKFANSRLMPDEIRSILKHIPHETLVLLGFRPETSHPMNYVMSAHIVPPPIIRPASGSILSDTRSRGENDMTVAFQDIVRSNNDLKAIYEDPKATEADRYQAWDRLQLFCGALINQALKKQETFDGTPLMHSRAIANRQVKDIKSRLTGKKGRLRGNLSGKRVDHAARSVVGPDAFHDIYELGVPQSIMRTLTFPEHVNDINLEYLSSCVAVGNNKLHGALTVRVPAIGGRRGIETGEKVHYLSLLDDLGRRDLAASLKPGMIVERHLRNGDWCLFNRQPSLHKGSIQAFRIYAVPSLQFKLPLPCTKPFNADFDGDEMNLHALQGYEAIAEAQEIMSVPFQMVTPQSNSVSIGLVQDSLVGAYKMSKKDTFIKKEAVMQLIMNLRYNPNSESYASMPLSNKTESFVDFLCSQSERNGGFLPTPAILKAVRYENGVKIVSPPLWTGKQLFSWMMPKSISFLKPISGASTGNIQDWMSDKVVSIRNGEVSCGRFCKQTLGSTTGGLIHIIWKHCGAWAAAHFVSDAQRLMMQWLAHDTVSISILDCMSVPEAAVDELVAESMGKADALMLSDVPEIIREQRQTQVLQDILRAAGAKVLENMDSNCGIATVVNSGAKGNLMNLAQISGIVGQQTLNGSRVSFRRGPRGLRTLPCFAPNDGRPEARGFVASSYLMGLQPYEFFFHQQAGREGVVATVSGTSETGYNHRKMIKGQESEVVMYDGSVRVSSNVIVQLHYNGDDYDGVHIERIKVPCLTISDPDVFLKNHLGLATILPTNLDNDLKRERDRLLLSWSYLRNMKKDMCKFGGDFSAEISMPANFERTAQFFMAEKNVNVATEFAPSHYVKLAEFILISIFLEIIKIHSRHSLSCFDDFGITEKSTLTDLLLLPSLNWRAVDDTSKIARHCLSLLCTSHFLKTNKISSDVYAAGIVREFMKLYVRGIVNAGEGVGAVGSSSIGEPSTQLTLNIFHYSGIAEKNVTLTGLPRFKQIINAIDTAETSNMKIVCLNPSSFFGAETNRNAEVRSNVRSQLVKDDLYKLNAKKFASSLPRVMLAEVVELSRVIYKPISSTSSTQNIFCPGFEDLNSFLRIEALAYNTQRRVNKWMPSSKSSSARTQSIAHAKSKKTKRLHTVSLSQNTGTGTNTLPKSTSTSNGTGIEDFDVSEESSSSSSYLCVFKLSKTELTQRSLSIDDVASALRLFVGSEANVVSTKKWCPEWIVSIRPPSFSSSAMGTEIDRSITEGVHDSLLESAIVNGLHGISKAIASFNKESQNWVVDTDGSDIASINMLLGLDKQMTYTNNIMEACRCFGVEAAVALQQAELHRVLSFDGSYVDPRHTWLLSDAVTRSGTTNPLNRHKMEELGGSLLQCASFEQTLDVFGVGAAFGSSDNLSGATEKLIVGQPVHVGTGSFEILLENMDKTTKTRLKTRQEQNEKSFVGPLHLHKSHKKQDAEEEEEEEEYLLPMNTKSLHCPRPTESEDEGILEPLFSSNLSSSSLSSSSSSSRAGEVFTIPKLVQDLNTVPLPIREFASAVEDSLSSLIKYSGSIEHSIDDHFDVQCILKNNISRTSFLLLEESLNKTPAWTLHDHSWRQSTQVFYDNFSTEVEYNHDKNNVDKSHTKVQFFSKRIHRFTQESQVHGEYPVTIQEKVLQKTSPHESCIVPSSVEITQRKTFFKNPFQVSLLKKWSGKNIIEAEKVQHECPPEIQVIINLKNWDIFQVRSHTSQSISVVYALYVAECIHFLRFPFKIT